MFNSFRKVLAGSTVTLICVAALAAPVPVKEGNGKEEKPTELELKSPERIALGRDKFVSVCAYCHGQAGDSGKNKPFRDRASNWESQDIFDVVYNGRQRGSNVMPAWSGSISNEEIWNIVAYIKSIPETNKTDK